MEQKLREHDRDFVERVSHRAYRLQATRGTRWSVLAFLAGTVLLLATFTSSIALGVFGLIVMVISALCFAQQVSPSARSLQREGARRRAQPDRHSRSGSLAEEWSEMRRRMRSRFGHRD